MKASTEPILVKRKPIKCLVCSARSVETIIYGYPMDDITEEDIALLGGCMMEMDAPAWKCTNCLTEYRPINDEGDL